MRGDGRRSYRSSRGGGAKRNTSNVFHHEPIDNTEYTDEHIERESSNRDYREKSTDENRISKQLGRLAREGNIERFLETACYLKKNLHHQDNWKYVKRNPFVLESLFGTLMSAPDRSCKWYLARCIGHVGNVMTNEVNRFIVMCFSRLEVAQTTEQKVLILRCVHTMFDLDFNGSQTPLVGRTVVQRLHMVLEHTDTVELMVMTVDILKRIHILDPKTIALDFQDVVDILVGWHIDYSQPEDVTTYVSLSLQSFQKTWALNVHVASTLLTQFIEDLEDYLQEPAETEDKVPEDHATSSKKVASFIGVFTTILRCLGPKMDISETSLISEVYLSESLHKMMKVANKVYQQSRQEKICAVLNQCCVVLLALKVSGISDDVMSLMKMHEDSVNTMYYTTQISLLKLMQMSLQTLDAPFVLKLTHFLMKKDSLLRKLRLSLHKETWQAALSVYRTIFAIKNVALLQEAYAYLLIDLQTSLQVLVPEAENFAPAVPGYTPGPFSVDVAISTFNYTLAILSEVANTRNSMIIMWALAPSIVELLGVHLCPANPQLANQYPDLHGNIVHLLISHCKEHSHYISSSSLIVGNSSSFVAQNSTSSTQPQSTTYQTGTSTSKNLHIILNLIAALLKLKKVASASVICEGVDWAAAVLIGCEKASAKLLHTERFKNLLLAIVQLGYHFISQIKTAAAQALLLVLEAIPSYQIECVKEIVDLCFYHCNYLDYNMRQQFLKALTMVPLSAIAMALNTNHALHHKASQPDKVDCEGLVELDQLNLKSLLLLQRHYLLHSSPHISSVSFHRFIQFILNYKWPEDEQWMSDIFTVSQRNDRIRETEDWSFSVLTPNMSILLWKWLAWEGAQFCVANRLKTPLGKPLETFTAIEDAIKKHSMEALEASCESEKLSPKRKPDFKYYLKILLLVEFIESLEKAMFNASDGCAVTPSLANKSVRVFFSTNRQTCLEWMTRIRGAVMTVALSGGQPHIALRHSYSLLKELSDNPNTNNAMLDRAVCYCVKALVAIKCPDAITGLYHWFENKTGQQLQWIKFAALCAGQRYEEALVYHAELYPTSEEDETTTKSFTKEFVQDQVVECHKNLENWRQIVLSYSEESEDETVTKPSFLKDLSHIETLSYFEECEWEQAETHITSSVVGKNKNECLLTDTIRSLDTTVLHSFSSAHSRQGSLTRESEETLRKCSSELDKHLKVFCFTDNNTDKINALVNLQLIGQLKGQHVSTGAMYEDWHSSHFESLSILNKIARYTKLMGALRTDQTEVSASLANLDLLCVKVGRKYNNFAYAQKKLRKSLQITEGGLAEAVTSHLTSNDINILHSQMYRQTAKLLVSIGEGEKSFDLLSGTVCKLNERLSALANQDVTLLSLPPNASGQVCARSIININKWLQSKAFHTDTNQPTPEWMQKLLTTYDGMKKHSPAELSLITDESLAGVPSHDANIGKLYMLGAIQCPNLGKIWYNIASWAFKCGRSVLSCPGTGRGRSLDEQDRIRIQALLAQVLSPETLTSQLDELCDLMGSGQDHSDAAHDQDLWLDDVEGPQKLEGALVQKLCEWGVDVSHASSLVSNILQIRQDAVQSGHAILTTAANAYFRFLKTGQENRGSHSDRQMTATLRLLRIIVKHATEMQDVLEKGLHNTPTAPWKSIIPQLFARLGHPEPYVRGSISDLLCRIAQDSPHLIIFPAVVGSSGAMGANQGSLTGVMNKYFNKKSDKTKLNSDQNDEVSSEEDDEEEEEQDGEEEEAQKPTSSKSQEDNRSDDDDEEEIDDDDTGLDSNEEQKKRALMQNCFSTLVNTLQKQLGGSIAEVQTFIHELRRITVLWDELWIGTLAQHLSDLSRKCHQLKADIVKLNLNSSLTMEQKEELVKKKYDIVFKPVIFVMDQLIGITSAKPETPHEVNFQLMFQSSIHDARAALAEPDNILEPSQSLSKFRALYQIFQQRCQKRSASNLNMSDISPVLSNMTNTKIAMPGIHSTSSEIISISSVGATINILPTKTKPKKLSFTGSDGRKYTYLFKGLEDLHLDQRIMQFLATVNTMFHRNKSSDSGFYQARAYSVVPLGTRSGLIQWVDNATPLFGLYKRWQQREAQLKSMKAETASANSSGKHTVAQVSQRPSELFYSKLTPKLKEVGIGVDQRKNWPPNILKEVFQELVKETPSNLLSRELWMTSVNCKEWWTITHNYNISSAVMSIIGYIIGLGDRHLDNLLVNLTTGEVVHIDYNVCFEKGHNLRVPERVPFRMTQNIEAALGVTGVEGVFRKACEHVLQTMRTGKETLLTLLEAFIYDPLIDWTPDSETGYAGAIYGGEQNLVQEARQSRQQLEKSLTISMFHVRLTEMKHDWLANKADVLSAIPEVTSDLETWKQTHQSVVKAEEKLVEGHRLISMIIGAETNSQHHLYSLISRHKEFLVVKNTVHIANEILQAHSRDLNKWIRLYQNADKVFRGGALADMKTKLLEQRAFVPSVAPVKDHLRKAGQSALATQCEQSEAQLKEVMLKICGVCSNGLDVLGSYGAVWLSYPHNHIATHRFSLQNNSLALLHSQLSRQNVQKAMDMKTFQDTTLTTSQALNVDKHLNNKTAQLNAKLSKIYSCREENGLGNVEALSCAHEQMKKTITDLTSQHAEQGVASVVCALLNSLVQSLTQRLREDKAVATTSEGLTEMMTGDTWWFDESVVSLGLICDIMRLLTKYSPPTSTAEHAVVKSLSALQDVFISLQDLIQNTSHIIVVEGGRLLGVQEDSVVEIASQLRDFTANIPTPLDTLMQQLTHHLHMTIFRMSSSYGGAVQEANYVHSQLLERIQKMTDTSVSLSGTSVTSEGEMTQGQMLLMGFHLLFETVDAQIDKLIDAVTFAVLPPPWPRIDTIRLSTDIMGPIFDPSIREVVRSILKVKKVQAITTFFVEALQLFAHPNKTHNQVNAVSDEERLTRIVKEYASECIFRLLLGLPSYLATHLLLLHSQKIGVDVTAYIESHDVGTEGRVPLEGIVEDALERSITQSNLQSVIATAADNVNAFLSSTRKRLLHRMLSSDAEGVKVLMERVKGQHLSHQWYHEDKLKTSPIQLSPSRSSVISDVQKLISNLCSVHQNVTDLRGNNRQLTDNVLHRLKWAAGSDPVIRDALEEFGQSVTANSAIVDDLVVLCDELKSLCRGVQHYETYRMTNSESSKQDNKYFHVLKKTMDSCRVHEQYTGSVSGQEEMLINLCPLPDQITPHWIKQSTSAVSEHLVYLTEDVSAQTKQLELIQDSVTSKVDQLRHHLLTHHRLMSEIRVLLKNLAKFEQEWELHGIDGFLCLYRRYSEVMSSTIRQILQEPLNAEKADSFTKTLHQLHHQTYVIYDKLVEFGTLCQAEEARQHTAAHTDTPDKLAFTERHKFFTPTKNMAMSNASARAKQRQGVQEHNTYALNVWRRVKAKLDGKDPHSDHVTTVAKQVDYSIRESRSTANLATLYEGWTPWV